MKRLMLLLLTSALVGCPALALAKEVAIDAVPLQERKPRLDGMLKEWPAFVGLTEVSGGARGLKAEGLVGYDDEALYVAMRVQDAKQTRTSAFGKNEDHATLELVFPLPGGGSRSYDVSLFPGVPGRSAGAVKVGGSKAAGASVIEAPEEGGLAFEAKIPWSAFAEAKRTRVGLRGALRYKDAESGTELATSKRQGGALPALTIECEYALQQSLIAAKGISAKPSRELVGNVVGDSMHERVAVYDRYLAVTGWNYRKGTEFYYQDMQIERASDVKRLALVDLTGDGHDDLVMERRVGSSSDAHQYLEVWHFRASDDGPQLIFQHEVGVIKGDNRVLNHVEIKQAGKQKQLVISLGPAKEDKVDPDSWDVLPAGENTRPMLLPWQAAQSRTFVYRAERFELIDEKTGKPRMAPPKRSAVVASHALRKADPILDEPGKGATPPPAARKPSEDELLTQVYDLYRQEHGVKRAKPSFDLVTNVAADTTLERVVVHGKDLVVFGKHFKLGTSYEYTTIGVENPDDIQKVTTRDLTGDGRAEVLVYGVIRAKASKRLGGDTITRHALFVYSVRESGIVRVFAAETARSLGEKRIEGDVKFTPGGAAVDIELGPGTAKGWTRETYPFPEDRSPYGGLEPLQLPWSEQPARRYRYRDGKFQSGS